MAITDVVNAWYSDGNDLIRRTLISETFHRFTICNSSVYRIDQGMPSGFPMTVIYNSFMNYYFLGIAWLNLIQDSELSDNHCDLRSLDNFCCIATYGDDNVISVHSEVLPIYNLQTVGKFLAQHGVSYTNDKKEALELSAPFVDISSVTFLKRSFVPKDRHAILMKAPLDKISITEQLNWIRIGKSGESPWEALAQNMQNALYEAFLHGDGYYKEIAGKLEVILKMHPQKVFDIPTIEVQNMRWWKDVYPPLKTENLDILLKNKSLEEGFNLSNLAKIPGQEDFLKMVKSFTPIPPLDLVLSF